MLTFFGTIIIVYFLWLVAKPLLTRYLQRKFQQKVNDMFRQAYGNQADGFPFGTGGSNNDERYERHRHRQPKRKIFSREEGEYVEFEDIKVEVDYTSANAENPGHGNNKYTPREPQVSDAEWEDVEA